MVFPVTRLLRACLLAIAAALLAPHTAAAQFCTEEPCEPMDATPPGITISPGSGTYSAGSLGVTINWSDNVALNHNSRVVTYGGVDVTSAFSYTWSNGGAAQSSGTVTVGSGSTTLTAYICDMASWPNCTSVGVTYTAPAPAVRVTPDTAAATVAGNTSQMSRFRVVNTGQAQTTYSLTPSCTNTTACYTSGNVSSLTLGPLDSANVEVAYQSPVSGPAQVRLTAAAGSASSTGTVNVTSLAAPDPGYPGDAASLMRMERGHCLTVAMGRGVASECGSLRVVHALPSVRALNKQRTPVLIYNHDLARPNPIVAQHLTPPAGPTPDSIRAVLTVNGVQYKGTWAGWPSTQTRRIAVGFLASGIGGAGNKVLPYHWQVTAEWNGQGSTVLVSENRRMVVVDRSGSPFGAGWWLAGVEQLHHLPGDTLKLWVGGDGSARLYRRPGSTGPWVADGFDRPETIEQTTNGSEIEYFRTLPGGARVYFNNQGEHVRTVNTLGHATTFVWTGSATTSRRLEHVILPATGANPTPLRYTFEYNNNATTAIPRLSRVVSPGPVDFRYTQVSTDAAARVTSITDPGSEPVTFGYSGATALMTRRTDRRQSPQTFGYSAGRFHASYVSPHPDSAATRRILHDVRGRGLAGAASVRADSVWAVWDGERTEFCDCTFWRLDRWGAPVWMRDAYGQVTTYARGDSRWPANVTQVVAPNGLLTTAGYDSRGNLVSTTTWNPYDDPRHATTTYQWDPRWDAPTRVVAPEGEATLVQYDALGRREWEQVGPSTTRRVTYRYYDNSHTSAPGLLRAVESPGALRDSVEYDARGNLNRVIDPRNVATESLSDRLGRVIRSRVPIGGGQAGFQQDTTIYDLADRVRETIATGPAMNNVSQKWLHVRNEYDPEGNLKEVARWSVPDGAGVDTIRTRWEYDLMGRQIVEIAPDSTPSTWNDNPRDSTFYDRAGNPVRVRTRRFAESLAANTTDPGAAYIRMEYDALNRLTRRILPAVLYEPRHQGIVARVHLGMALKPYPYYPNDGWRLRIPADTAVFGYHPTTGVQNLATNGNAIVRRQVYPNGQLKYDSIYTATWENRNFTTHKYGLEYRYDRNGRVTELLHPGQLLPPLAAARGERGNRYGYDGVTGALQSVTDPMGNAFRYHYNFKGEPDSLVLPGGIRHEYAFDGSGQLTTHRIRNAAVGGSRYPGTWLRDEVIGYDSRGKMLWAKNQVGLRDTLSVSYSGLGHLRSSTHKYWGWSTHTGQSTSYTASEAALHDALGNLVTMARAGALEVYGTGLLEASHGRRNTSSGAFGYQPGSGRLMERAEGGQAQQYEFTHYDAGGNMVFVTAAPMDTDPGEMLDRASFYDGGGRLWASDVRRVEDGSAHHTPTYLTYEEYRLDALGRRVQVRVRRQCHNTSIDADVCSMSSVRRTVWAGDEELYEIQMPEDQAENDVGPVASEPKYGGGFDPNLFWGRVAYTSGGTIDRPLSIVRMGYVNNPASGLYRWDEFAIVPHWNMHGRAQSGTFHDGARVRCRGTPATSADSVNLCVQVAWADGMFPYSPAPAAVDHWHGTLLAEKRDASGLLYRRNRYYDPATGRFTQEDPIGIAGGLNLYGYAGGDPVNFSDPFGLSAQANCCPQWLVDGAAGFGDALSFGLTGVIRRNTPGGDGVDYESGSYTAGQAGGVAVGLATGAAGGARLLGARGAVGGGAAGAGGNAFRSGSIITRAAETSQGVLDLQATVRVSGSQLVLRNVSVMPRFADELSLGTGEMLRIMRPILAEARAAGFETVRITGLRRGGASPRRIADFTVNLAR